MLECPDSSGLLILPRLRVQNANAVSSPLTWGFPSMTAFLGLMWAVERRLDGKYPLIFDSVGVVCHNFEAQTANMGFHNVFCLTRNPVEKDGGSASIIEEGRAHLDITLLFGVSGGVMAESEEHRAEIAREIMEMVSRMRIAGGSVLPKQNRSRLRPGIVSLAAKSDDDLPTFHKLRYSLLPGFTLVERDDLLQQRLENLRQENPDATHLEAWMSLSRMNWRAVQNLESGQDAPTVEWKHDREGWIVPIPLGYAALTDEQPAGTVDAARDPNTPFYFVESIYGIGQWISPHRISDVRAMLWYAAADKEQGLFRCHNDYIHFYS
jgi:CRISPR-associated protein Csy2